MTALDKTNAALVAELRKASVSVFIECEEPVAKVISDLMKLAADRLEQADRDAQRLDWLEKKRYNLVYSALANAWYITMLGQVWKKSQEATIRETIDAARTAQQEEQG